jgi:hypothetical protein
LTSALFLARARGVFFPQAGVAFPVVFVFYRPVTANRFAELGRAPFFFFETGDEVTRLFFDFITPGFAPLTGDSDELPRSGEAADLFVDINSRNAAAFEASVFFFPLAGPLVGDAFGE